VVKFTAALSVWGGNGVPVPNSANHDFAIYKTTTRDTLYTVGDDVIFGSTV